MCFDLTDFVFRILLGVKYSPMVILFTVNVITAIATPISSWVYSTSGTTWQVGQSNAGADQYAAKFDMSVSINPTAPSVLVGIQAMNTVLLFTYSGTALTLVTSKDNGQAIGFGKSVAWLSDTLNSVAILANVYSSNYVWSSSKIYLYDSPWTNTSTPISIFPNIQQQLYSYMSSIFLNIITTSTHLVLLDDQGGLFVILSAPSGYYASTAGPTQQIVPAFSSQLPCIAGTYKQVTGIRRCLPCPAGTKNDGTNTSILTCINCASDTFCPFASSSGFISNDLLSNVTQAVAYPVSPEITSIDDILIFTLFSIGSTGRCVVLSPLFWTLIIASIVSVIAIVMLVLKHCVKNPKAKGPYKMLEKTFKQTDLIGEGELWIGGLATFCVLALSIASCVFSAQFYNSYPIEVVGPSTYTCDTTLRNALFASSIQSSAVPISMDMQDIVDLLNDQPFYLNVAFLNTVYTCTSDAITVSYFLGTSWLPISTDLTCNSANNVLSYSALLPFKSISVRFYLPNIYTIGGLRIGLSGAGQAKSSATTLKDLGFSQIFSQNRRMVGQDANIALELTKVINATSPLVNGDDNIFSGIWIGSFAVNYYESFYTDSDYLTASPEPSTNITLVISETSYYILNQQDPIARLPEIIFHAFFIYNNDYWNCRLGIRSI